MGYKTILLDLDDTLVVEQKTAHDSFLAAARYLERRHRVSPEDFVAIVRAEARELWYSLPTIQYAQQIGISSWEALWADFSNSNEQQTMLKEQNAFYQKTVWKNALHKYGIEDEALAVKLASVYKEERRKNHYLFSDTEPFLQKLLDLGKSVACITNGTPDLQWQKIKNSGVEKYFHAVSISGELGFKKPQKEIFEHCLSLLGAAGSQSLMIGNNLETDIQGANNAGIASVWLNRELKKNTTAIHPAYEVHTLDEALPLLE
jgi:putative hydrolase of the HAD superfamily